MPMPYTMKFMVMVWAAFLARVKPVSTSAKPACMNITRKPASRTHTKFRATRVCPTAAPISCERGGAGDLGRHVLDTSGGAAVGIGREEQGGQGRKGHRHREGPVQGSAVHGRSSFIGRGIGVAFAVGIR